MKTKINIKNIVCLIDFEQYLEIDDQMAEDAGLEASKNLSSHIYTHPELKTKMVIFPSGKIFLSGAKNHDEIESSFWALIGKLKEIGTRVVLGAHTKIEIENLLATADIYDYLPDLDIDLEKISLKQNAVYGAVYEPEEFPAVFLDFTPLNVSGSAMLFKSGRVLIGDVKSPGDAHLVLGRVIEAVRYP